MPVGLALEDQHEHLCAGSKSSCRYRRFIVSKQEVVMEPLAWLGLLALVVGIVGVFVLMQGKKKRR
jgi:hypothetical protein